MTAELPPVSFWPRVRVCAVCVEPLRPDRDRCPHGCAGGAVIVSTPFPEAPYQEYTVLGPGRRRKIPTAPGGGGGTTRKLTR